MKTLNAAAMIRLFIILILTVHTTLGIEMGHYENSIDDAFVGCNKEMYEHVVITLLERELGLNKDFKTAWDEAKESLKKKDKLNPSLQEMALCAYTTKHIYRDLNNKMREGKDHYTTDFGLISLHFLITDAIQARNPQATCRTTYRRTTVPITIKGERVRFGAFTSSTCNPYSPKFMSYGKETCFVISTCHGAPISDLSVVPDEDEILIPPYEEFESEKLKTLPELSDCNVVYKLTSKGMKSNMKCEYVNQHKKGKSPG
ncbi:ecto-ADP-ribosyltransferase 5-like [Colossoma macropomum]|uniref:ecto-ADP-ribosyltransferase 5-like n=1 Tax=Colossoma macropomum TaxID=42526 RepID=UPI0018650BAD|nr:ecto-ADP-ribosyltransferase 5-like [Colossoma macropomum]